jgi:hypothetical protein
VEVAAAVLVLLTAVKVDQELSFSAIPTLSQTSQQSAVHWFIAKQSTAVLRFTHLQQEQER